MCHRKRIPRKPVSDKPASGGGRDFRSSMRLGPPNEGLSVYSLPEKLKMLGIEVDKSRVPRTEDIDAAVSFIYSVRPGCAATSKLEFDHIRVLIAAACCLEMPDRGCWDVKEFKGMLSDLIEGNPVDRERFREKAEELFGHLRQKPKA